MYCFQKSLKYQSILLCLYVWVIIENNEIIKLQFHFPLGDMTAENILWYSLQMSTVQIEGILLFFIFEILMYL